MKLDESIRNSDSQETTSDQTVDPGTPSLCRSHDAVMLNSSTITAFFLLHPLPMFMFFRPRAQPTSGFLQIRGATSREVEVLRSRYSSRLQSLPRFIHFSSSSSCSSPAVSDKPQDTIECYVGIESAAKVCTSISNMPGGLISSKMKHSHVVIHVVSPGNAALLEPLKRPL